LPQFSNGPKARKKYDDYSAEEDDFDDEPEFSDDEGHGAVFLGPIHGFVKEARGIGNATALKKVTYVDKGNGRYNSGLQQRPESNIAESRDINPDLSGESPRERIKATNPKRTIESRQGQSRFDFQQSQATDAVIREFQAMSPDAKAHLASLTRLLRLTDDER